MGIGLRRFIAAGVAAALAFAPLAAGSGFAPGPCAAWAAPAPETAYAAEFMAKCEGQQWFADEIERLLNLEQKTLASVAGPEGFKNIRILGFKDAGISGRVPAAVGELKELRYLFLSGNRLSGELPAGLFALPKLREIDLAGNAFAGEIPAAFGLMPALLSLNLKGNGFTGAPPAEVLGNARLRLLNLSGNRLGGGAPDVSRMASLEYLNLSKNDWGGPMPDVSRLTSLAALSMHECGFTGEIPSGLWGLRGLRVLDLAYNGLTGEIPQEVGNLKSLEFLSLAGNRLGGGIPDAVGRLTSLKALNLSGNRLRGLVPDILGAESLEEIRLGGNCLRGHVPNTLKARADAGAAVSLEDNYMTGAVLKNMTGNGKNFADGAVGEQYQLSVSRDPVRISKTAGMNIHALLRNVLTPAGNGAQKPPLNPDEYDLAYDASRIEAVATASGIFVRALADAPLKDGLALEVRIKGNDGSDRSKVSVRLTTDAAPSGGGGGTTTVTEPAIAEAAPEMHEAYVTGYPDGTFKPEREVSREEAAAMLARALGTGPNASSAPSFADVAPVRWSFQAVEESAARGWLKGYGDGAFRPSEGMTRAEFAAMLARVAKKRGVGAEAEVAPSFPDVKDGAWYRDEVAEAASLGLIKGYEDGTFRPEGKVSRAEAVAMTNRLLGREPACEAALGADAPFADVGEGHWAHGHAWEAATTHFRTREADPDGRRPQARGTENKARAD
ncbi:MAG: S-layer homology domain-containing protein [Clostridiales Family XIII bacterium]|jgi:hypothetical protein|nr:S-layer homology domain-containing protein [Clostridiales Family XIII bacterium]